MRGMNGNMGAFWDGFKKPLPATASAVAQMRPEKYYAEDYNPYASMSGFGTMGADCQPGYYKLKVFGVDTGQCLPTLSTAAGGAQAGALTTVASGAATSPANLLAAQQAGIHATGNAVANFVKAHPYMVFGGLAAAVLLMAYGGMSFARGR